MKLKYDYKIPPVDLECGVSIMLYVMGGKWKPYLINCMTHGIHRPVEFYREIKGASKRVLVKQLRVLEEVGIVRRVVYDTIPVSAGYYLTDRGESLVPIVNDMYIWGLNNRDIFEED